MNKFTKTLRQESVQVFRFSSVGSHLNKIFCSFTKVCITHSFKDLISGTQSEILHFFMYSLFIEEELLANAIYY